MKSSLSIFVTAIALLGNSASFAGESGAHGGNTVQCQGQPAVVLDYYNAALPSVGSPNGPKLIDVNHMSTNEVIDYFKAKLSKTALAKDFEMALETLDPINDWTATADSNLKDTGDSNEAYNLPSTCEKLQAAARQGTSVYVDSKVIALLNEGQRGILAIHEALYYLAEIKKGANTSEQVRPLIRTVLNTSSSEKDIFKAVTHFGYYAFGLLVGHDYQFNDPEYCEKRFLSANFIDRTLRAIFVYHDSSSSRAQFCASLKPIEYHCDTDGITCHYKDYSDLVMLDQQGLSFQIINRAEPSSETYKRFQ